MKQCAFLTLDERGDYVIDDEHAVEPLARLGWDVTTLSWRQTATPWDRFDAVIVRSTWDYWHDLSSFMDTLVRIDQLTRLANPLGLLRWNLNKTYLRDLQDRGVVIVPTIWVNGLDLHRLADFAERLESDQLVVKPTVGANGDDAFRLSPLDRSGRLRDIAARFDGRDCMLQPFRSKILDDGEFSLFCFAGAYSHAIRKRPAAGEFRSQEERGASIEPVVPDPRLRRCATDAVAALPHRALYARIDLVRNDDGDFEVMELEAVEPSLYLRTDPDAPERFARAIDQWFAAPAER